MHDRARTWVYLHFLDPLVFSQLRVDREPGVLDGSLGAYGKVAGNLDDQVGVSDLPVVGEGKRSRGVGEGRPRCACLNPSVDDLYFGRTETAIVRKVTICGVSRPGWHLSCEHRLADRLCPRARVLTSQERERR